MLHSGGVKGKAGDLKSYSVATHCTSIIRNASRFTNWKNEVKSYKESPDECSKGRGRGCERACLEFLWPIDCAEGYRER